MEVVIFVAVLGMLSVVSVNLFLRNIRSTNKSDSTSEADQNAQYVLQTVERFIRNARKVEAVGLGQCPGTSDNITLLASDELSVTFSLDNGRVASNGAYLTSPSVTVTDLSFECVRQEGLPDEITTTFTLTQTPTAQDVTTEKTYSQTVTLRNFE